MKKHGITFVIRTLRGGGAERVMAMLANYFADNGRDVTVISSIPHKESDQDVYTLNENIQRIHIPYWNIKLPVWENDYIFHPFHLRKLKKTIEQAGNKIVIPFMEKSVVPVLKVLDCCRYRVIGNLHCHPAWLNPGPVKRYLWKKYYKRAHTIVGLSQSWVNDFIPGTLVEEKYTVIPNFTYAVDMSLKPNREIDLPENFICATGRLHPQKGFDMLIPVFMRINKDYPDLHLVIFGEGEERENLEYLIKTLNLQDRVHLVGFVANPHLYIKKARMFVLSSRHEGMPVALIEMLSIGMPVVSFDCPTGPRDLITNGVNGLLVRKENSDDLERAIRELLANPEKARKLGEVAKEVPSTHSQAVAFARWEALINFGESETE